ncbi:MAG: VOC family protein [Bacteroidota bacterium]
MKVRQILVRIYVHDIDPAIEFYEKLLNEKCASRFVYEQAGLEIARVSDFLIIAGTGAALAPFRSTSATMLVDSLQEYRKFLTDNGCIIIRDVQKVPTGFNMTVKHNDGTIIEYVEHTAGGNR